MALPWLTALKLIPWSDVIAAAPQVVKSAQKLYDSVKNRSNTNTSKPPLPLNPKGEKPVHPDQLSEYVQDLTQRLALLEQEQRATSELIRDLAQHNERLFEAVETLRQRSRFLLRMNWILVLGLLGLAIYILRA